MKLSMHEMSVGSFAPMLESLSAILDKGEAHAKSAKRDLVGANLAPDMYTLAQQVQLACDNACNAAARLAAKPAPGSTTEGKTFADMRAQIAKAVVFLRSLPATAFEGSEERDCSVPIPDMKGMVVAMNGVQFLRAWALPHFYFHVVTAYDILRHNGVVIGKRDYVAQVGAFVRPG